MILFPRGNYVHYDDYKLKVKNIDETVFRAWENK
jgi:hypothetical protein